MSDERANSILRQHRKIGYSQIPNELARDIRLSPNARALIILLLTFPDNWEFNMTWIRDRYYGTGEFAFRKAMNELLEARLVEREKRRMEDGRVRGYIYTIRDERP